MGGRAPRSSSLGGESAPLRGAYIGAIAYAIASQNSDRSPVLNNRAANIREPSGQGTTRNNSAPLNALPPDRKHNDGEEKTEMELEKKEGQTKGMRRKRKKLSIL
jgi:hypothetical protein